VLTTTHNDTQHKPLFSLVSHQLSRTVILLLIVICRIQVEVVVGSDGNDIVLRVPGHMQNLSGKIDIVCVQVVVRLPRRAASELNPQCILPVPLDVIDIKIIVIGACQQVTDRGKESEGKYKSTSDLSTTLPSSGR